MAISQINLNNPFGIAGSVSAPVTTIEKQQVEQKQAATKQQQTQQANPQKPATFGEAAVAYLRHVDKQAAKAQPKAKGNVLNQVAQQLGKSISEVTPQDVQRFLQKQQTKEQQQTQQQSFNPLAKPGEKQLGEVVAALLNMFEELNADDDADINETEFVNVGEDISDAEKFAIEDFLKEQGLNEYGDPIGTTYDKEPPTFDPSTGDYKSRYQLLAEKFENRPWK